MTQILEQLLNVCGEAVHWRYGADGPGASEPAAWAAIALAMHGRAIQALRPAAWLAARQNDGGAVGVTAEEDRPHWPTGLALRAWTACLAADPDAPFEVNVRRGVKFAVGVCGKTAPRSPEVGHDTQLVGWSWAEGTHSWLEPTAMFVIGMKSAGFAGHPRVREAVRLIVDRLLPSGGANYGNTIVLGQELLPHVQPTAYAMWALRGEQIEDPRIGASLAYLDREYAGIIGPQSLCLATMALTAFGRRPTEADHRLGAAAELLAREGDVGEYDAALLAAALSHHFTEPVVSDAATISADQSPAPPAQLQLGTTEASCHA